MASLPSLPNLAGELKRLLTQVPRGRVTTFGDLATALGDVRAARWVAQVLAETSSHQLATAAHRVVRKTGEIPASAVFQRERLIAEGCPFLANGRVDLDSARCNVMPEARPLKQLCDWQRQLADAATLTAWDAVPETIGGVDLSYLSDEEAVAAYVSVTVHDGSVCFSHTVRRRVPFPYLPGYLTFREAPVLLDLLCEVRARSALDPVILVDGSGRLHPRRAGIAVAVGLLGEVATVGVSKHQLCGRIVQGWHVENAAVIEDAGEPVGAVLDGGSKRRTLFVSPGHGIDLASSLRCVRAVWQHHRLPLPTHQADRLSREQVQKLKCANVPVLEK